MGVSIRPGLIGFAVRYQLPLKRPIKLEDPNWEAHYNLAIALNQQGRSNGKPRVSCEPQFSRSRIP